MVELSILIPARNEEFLKRTIEDILEHIEAETEIIVVLDGALADPPLEQHERVTVIYHKESVGQRAACNEAAKLARGKYVMKVDAHCSFDQGFDRKMLEAFREVGDDVTMVPLMKNLHVFDWVCEDGHRRYQGPSGPCEECGKPTEKDIVWQAKPSPNSTAYCFNTEPKFQYHGEWKKQQQGDLVETMSLQGSCFMLTKERYFALDVCDEAFGSWGSQGLEVGIKSWLSGGRVLCNKRTFYAHCFRTQGADFGFPYPLSGNQVEHAKNMAREIFFKNKWPLQVRNIDWLIEKFWPVSGWEEEDLKALKEGRMPGPPKKKKTEDHPLKPRKGVIYYTHNKCPENVFDACQRQILKGIKEKHVISVSSEPIQFGTNIVRPQVEGWLDIFEKILVGLEACTAPVIFFCEHDVLYSPSHFDFIPPDPKAFYYNTNVWKWRLEDGHCLKVDDCKQLSGLVAYRDLLLEHFTERVKRVREEGFTRGNGFEPGTRDTSRGGYDDHPAVAYQSQVPNIDVRHDSNATQNRWSKEQFRNQKYTEGWTECSIDQIPGWDDPVKLLFG